MAWSLLCLLLACLASRASVAATQPTNSKCEQIRQPFCLDIAYNMTYQFPNAFGHNTQEEANTDLQQFSPLVSIRCSPDLKLLLCSFYMPICTILAEPIPPCQSLCKRVMTGCYPVMAQYGFNWPERMNCDELPAAGQLCVDSPAGSSQTTVVPSVPSNTSSVTRNTPYSTTTPQCYSGNVTVTLPPRTKSLEVQIGTGRTASLKEGDHKYIIQKTDHSNCTKYISVKRCDSTYFKRVELQARYKVDCRLMKDSLTKSLVEKAVEQHYVHVDEICGKYCNANRLVKPNILCSKKRMTVTWATDLKYSDAGYAGARVPMKKMRKKTRAKGTMMTIVLPFSKKQIVFPRKVKDGSSAKILLSPFCSDARG